MKISAASRLVASNPAWAAKAVTILRSFCTVVKAKFDENGEGSVVGLVPKTGRMSVTDEGFVMLGRVCTQFDLSAEFYVVGNALKIEIKEFSPE
jgi:hypothetical protein